MEIKEKIKNLIKKETERLGYVLKKIEIKKKGGEKELLITIDKKGGVSVEDCAKLSRRIDPMLEKENIFEGRWYLTVSSPGIDKD
jgi:ribosome maturation factor RimP